MDREPGRGPPSTGALITAAHAAPMKPQVLSLLMLVTIAPPSQAERLDFVPRQFQGTWALRRDQCDRTPAQMVIRARSVILDGHEGRIHAVVAHGRFEAAFIAEFRQGKPARLWARTFELSIDDMRLVDSTKARSEVWFKCP
jgi:hypothetical protein